MKAEEAKEILEYHNQWRRGADIEQPDVKKLSEAIEVAIYILSNTKDQTEEEKKWDISFDNHLWAGIKIKNNIPEIIGAVNGWGDTVNEDRIKIKVLE